MTFTKKWKSISFVILGLMVFSNNPAFAQYNSSYDSHNHSSNPYGRSNDPYNQPYSQPPPPYQTQSSPYSSAAGNQSGYSTPFGLSKPATGAIAGAILGAGSGAIIGSHRGKAGQGAAIGAGLGAVGGYMMGRQFQNSDQILDEQDRVIESQRQEIARNRALLNELKRQHLDARETERGVVVNLPDVFFEFNRANLTGTAQMNVEHIAHILRDQASGRHVSVEGHTDSIGSDAYNLALSRRRATTVTQALAANGVNERRLVTRGYGEKYPIAPNTYANGSDNPMGRAKNRRVEVVIEN